MNAKFARTKLYGQIFALWLALPPAAVATHYPDGASCYDCHAVSKGKTVPGTRLIKASKKTVDLEIDQSSVGSGMRCLFCHSTDAVSAPLTATRVMRPVDDHFNANSLSRHGDWEKIKKSNQVEDDGNFDCLDCHTGLSGGVAPGGGTVHGKNAATQQINVYRETLVKTSATALDTLGSLGTYQSPSLLTALQKKTLSAATCVNASCHAVAAVDVGKGYVAPAKHAYTTNISLNDGAAPTGSDQGCLECHGTHSSTDGAALLVLPPAPTGPRRPIGRSRLRSARSATIKTTGLPPIIRPRVTARAPSQAGRSDARAATAAR